MKTGIKRVGFIFLLLGTGLIAGLFLAGTLMGSSSRAVAIAPRERIMFLEPTVVPTAPAPGERAFRVPPVAPVPPILEERIVIEPQPRIFGVERVVTPYRSRWSNLGSFVVAAGWWVRALSNTLIAWVLIIVGAWFILRHRQPSEKSPEKEIH